MGATPSNDFDAVKAFESLQDGPPARSCHVRWYIDQMSPELREAVESAFERVGVEVATIHELLNKAGLDVGYSSVSHHARGVRNPGGRAGCKCKSRR